ncbi:ATP-grasp domain-containing protein [Streptomyces sp. MRC013]|uniref:ATP-grasp domain-containing protein n=1 Tax=Streptomyces sp. MRC013 TaxID=2898276 RepID=UPI0020270CD4|nr:ATP-grasp domain-containing protein [Streptomyces sp. MRC013]URM88713.1 ATP-grasp domain-containing protein [Streptomyces sp. MRC013]
MTSETTAPSGPRAGRPLLLLVGSGSRPWREYLLRSITTGYRLHLFCPAAPTWEQRYLDGHTVVDTADAAAMTAAARAGGGSFAGVLTYEETRVVPTAELATALGLRTSPPAAVNACRDKYLGRLALGRAGVPQAEAIAVADLAQAGKAARRIGYPVVVKPRALSASCGVTLATGPHEIEEAYRQAAGIWFDDVPRLEAPVLVEEFLDGPEVSVDAFCRDGRVTALFVAHKDLGFAPGFEEIGHTVRADDPLLHDERLLGVLQDAHAAVGLTDAVTHTELRLTADGPKVVEINARIGGGRIPYLGRLVTGTEIGLVAADLAVGAVPEIPRPAGSTTAAVRFLYPERDMRLASVEIDEAALPAPVREVLPLAEPGRELRLPPVDNARSRFALVIAVAEDERDCAAALDEAAAAVTAKGTPLP